MTPPNEPRTSGNPAKRAQIERTVKQQREDRKQAKLAEYQRQLARRRRSKIVWWTVGSVAALAVVGLVIASVILTPRPVEQARGAGDGSAITGIETFENTANHVDGAVEYPQSPPAGGNHNAAWLNCAVYSEPVPNENAVHSLEHGAVWVTYDPELITQEQVDALTAQLPSTYMIVSPYPGLPSPAVVSAWDAQVAVDSLDDERVGAFIDAYWRSTNAPEPQALCTGAFDAPGKQS